METLATWETGREMASARRQLARADDAMEKQRRRVEQTAYLLGEGVIPAAEHEAATEELERRREDLAAAERELEAVRARAGPDAPGDGRSRVPERARPAQGARIRHAGGNGARTRRRYRHASRIRHADIRIGTGRAAQRGNGGLGRSGAGQHCRCRNAVGRRHRRGGGGGEAAARPAGPGHRRRLPGDRTCRRTGKRRLPCRQGVLGGPARSSRSAPTCARRHPSSAGCCGSACRWTSTSSPATTRQ